MDFIAIDFETANHKRCSACTLGISIYKNNINIDNKYFIFKPYPFEFDEINLRITGLKESDFENLPNFEEIWNTIELYFNDSLVFAHNASFDINVLKQTLDIYNIPYPNFDFCCTYLMSKVKFENLQNYKLGTISNLLELKSFEHHNALEDAIICGEIANIYIQNKNIDDICNDFQIKLGHLDNQHYYNCKIPSKYYTNSNFTYQKYNKRASLDNINKYRNLFINNSFLRKKNIVITGDFDLFNRNELTELLKLSECNVKASVSKTTNILLTGEYKNITSKYKQAQHLILDGYDIQIIDEQSFMEHLEKGACINV